jgi:phosphoglycolate phosphatase-like HAD superfamily hydrolase
MAWAKRWTQLRARNVPLAICTNKPEALVPPLLQHLGIGDAFALVLGGIRCRSASPAVSHCGTSPRTSGCRWSPA